MSQYELMLIESISGNTALAVFTGEVDSLDEFMKMVEKEALAHVPDVSTAKGRSAITANETKVKKAKLFIEKEGKLLADRQKEIPKLIDASRKKSREFFESLQEKVRAPLTEYERVQKDIADKKARDEREAAERIEAESLFSLLWNEAHVMNDRFDIDKEKAEIAKAKQAELDEKARLVREAELIEQGRLAAELANKQALEKSEREKIEAERREQQAIENARIAKENAELIEKQRLIDADNARVAALAKAERDRLQAVEEERKSVEKETADKKAIDDARKADIEHRSNIMRESKEAIMALGIDEDTAKMIVKAAVSGKLGALIIDF